MNDFNFEKVALVMNVLDWGWASEYGDRELKVPSILQLKETARYLLRESVESGMIGTGGFQASYHSEDGEDEFSLCFIVEERESWADQ